MKNYSLIILASSFIYSALPAGAQTKTRTLTGIVKSFEESFPLEGVAVIAKGTNAVSGTQADGVYYITVSEKDSALLFSLPGYQSQEIKITANKEYNIILKASNSFSSSMPQQGYFIFLPIRCRMCIA